MEITVDASAAIRDVDRIQVMVERLARPIKGWRLRIAHTLFRISSFLCEIACKIAPKSAISDGPLVHFERHESDQTGKPGQ